MVAALTSDGRTHLTFLPLVQHGETAQVIRPVADHSGFMLQSERPSERYPQMSWDVTLAPNRVRHRRRRGQPDTLGQQCFVRPDEAVPVQRLLVIRTGRAVPEDPLPAPDDNIKSPPLAYQASQLSTIRGTPP